MAFTDPRGDEPSIATGAGDRPIMPAGGYVQFPRDCDGISRLADAGQGQAVGRLAILLLLTAGFRADGAAAAELERAAFALCGAGQRVTCIVDGDTFWLRGTKIRIADINAPESGQPACPREAVLAARSTARLAQLLNAGPFTLHSKGRDEDRYGRKLRVVRRGGRSLGAALEAEGLAEHWAGRRGDWCAG